jgi:hypothetical protein
MIESLCDRLDVGAGPSDEDKLRSRVTAGVARKRTLTAKSHNCDAYRSTFAVLSPVMMTASR